MTDRQDIESQQVIESCFFSGPSCILLVGSRGLGIRPPVTDDFDYLLIDKTTQGFDYLRYQVSSKYRQCDTEIFPYRNHLYLDVFRITLEALQNMIHMPSRRDHNGILIEQFQEQVVILSTSLDRVIVQNSDVFDTIVDEFDRSRGFYSRQVPVILDRWWSPIKHDQNYHDSWQKHLYWTCKNFYGLYNFFTKGSYVLDQEQIKTLWQYRQSPEQHRNIMNKLAAKLHKRLQKISWPDRVKI